MKPIANISQPRFTSNCGGKESPTRLDQLPPQGKACVCAVSTAGRVLSCLVYSGPEALDSFPHSHIAAEDGKSPVSARQRQSFFHLEHLASDKRESLVVPRFVLASVLGTMEEGAKNGGVKGAAGIYIGENTVPESDGFYGTIFDLEDGTSTRKFHVFPSRRLSEFAFHETRTQPKYPYRYLY